MAAELRDGRCVLSVEGELDLENASRFGGALMPLLGAQVSALLPGLWSSRPDVAWSLR